VLKRNLIGLQGDRLREPIAAATFDFYSSRMHPQTTRRDFLFLFGSSFLCSSAETFSDTKKPIEPVFFANWPDNNHCLQASIMMALNTLGHPVRWADVNAATGYRDGLYTWSIQGAAVLARFIPGVMFYSTFDYARFAVEGEAYFKRTTEPDWFRVQQQHASRGFFREQMAAQMFLERHRFELKKLSSDEMFGALNEYLLIPLTDVARLYPGASEAGHSILLYASGSNDAWFHDPGLPPYRAHRLPKDRIYEAYRVVGDLILIPHGGRRFGRQTGNTRT
jgi:hypothetical protein